MQAEARRRAVRDVAHEGILHLKTALAALNIISGRFDSGIGGREDSISIDVAQYSCEAALALLRELVEADSRDGS